LPVGFHAALILLLTLQVKPDGAAGGE